MSIKGDTLRLQEQLETKFDEREAKPQRFRAIMGDGTGTVKVPGKRNYVYIRRLGRGLIEECLNNKAPARDGLPIIAGCSHESPDLLQVLEVDWTSFAEPGHYAYITPHHESHEFRNVYGGDDVVWVQSQQILPLLVSPTSPASMFVEVFGGWYPWHTEWHYFEEVTSADLTAHIPALAGQARYVLISIDGATEALQYTVGGLFPAFLPPLDAEDSVPTAPLGSIPVAAVYLTGVTTAIDWENLYDLRLFNQPTGGSVYPGPHALLDSVAHDDTVTNAPTRGSLVLANATPAWNELVHPGGAGYALTTDANDVVWDQTPTWTGNHTFNAGLTIPAAQGITMGDLSWIGLPGAGRLTFDDAVPDVASFDGCGHVDIENILGHIGDPDTYMLFSPDFCGFRVGGVDFLYMDEGASDYFLVDPAESGIRFGLGTLAPAANMHLYSTVDGAIALAIDCQGLTANQQASLHLITLGDGTKPISDVATKGWEISGRGDATGNPNDLIFSFWTGAAFNIAARIVPAGLVSAYFGLSVEAIGVADALQVRNADGQITLGMLGAGFVQSTAAGVLSSGPIGAGDLPVHTHAGAAQGGATISATLYNAAATVSAVFTHSANLVLDDGTGDSPSVQWIPENNDVWTMFAENDATPGNSDLVVTMPAADADARFIWRNSTPADVAYVDAAGNVAFEGHMAVGETAAVLANTIFNADGDIAVAGNAFRLNPTITAAITVNAIYMRVDVAAAVAATAAVGLSIDNPTLGGGATLGTSYGVYINPLTAATTNWAIYTAGSTRSYFGGDVGVGIVPVPRLHVYQNTADVGVAAGLTIEQDGAGDAVVQFLLTGLRRWVIGIDSSDGSKFKIASDADLNTNAWLVVDTTGRCALGGVTAPLAQLHVDQAAAGGVIPTLLLDQADLSEEFIDFVCASTGAGDPVDAATAVGATYARLRVAVNGVFKYLQLYDA